jgi:hypothetical protein
MENRTHPKHYPTVTPTRPPVDLYLSGRSENDTAFTILNTGLSRPIYDLNGNVSRQLPLENWPLENDLHPEVYLMRRRAEQAKCKTCPTGNLGHLAMWSTY